MILEKDTPSSKTITLKQILTHDLSTVYSRHMGGNKFKHYCVPVTSSIIGLNPIEEIHKYIQAEEGENITFVTISEVEKYEIEEVLVSVKKYDELKRNIETKAKEAVKKKASFWNDYPDSEFNQARG